MKSDFTGLTSFVGTTTEASGSVLTLGKMNKAIRYFQSKKYEKECLRREKMRAKGEMMVADALQQGIINVEEYMKLLMGISINGFLLVSPEMGSRLKQVKPRKRTRMKV